jgi:hypothetical protein
MTTPHTIRPTIYLPSHEAAAARRAVTIWLATGTVPVAHIVAEPDPVGEMAVEEPIAA